MKVLHFMASGETGGIEILNKEYAKYTKLEHTYVFFWNGGCVAEEMRKLGQSIVKLNASKLNFFGPLKSVLHLCKEELPDVIIVHYIAPVLYLYAMLIKKKYPRVRIIAYIHESVSYNRKKTVGIRELLKQRIICWYFEKADHFVVISDFVKQRLIENYQIQEHKVYRIYNGVDLKKYQKPIHKTEKKAELIYVGRLTKDKGVHDMIRMLSLLSKDIFWHLRIVGDGEHRKQLENLTRELKLESNIDFLGNRQDVPELLSGADVFLHMPQRDEGFGIAVVEAMAAGLICVCAKSGAIPEIIQHDKNGYLLQGRTVKYCAEQLAEILKEIDCEDTKRLRRAARERGKEFSLENYVDALDTFLALQERI